MKPDATHRPQNAIHMEKVYPHPPERVWQALTDPRALSQWLLPTTFKPKAGHRFRFTHLSEDGKRRRVHCRVVELEAPHRLAYTWQAGEEEAASLVTWTLEAVEEGTRLRLEHTGLETSCMLKGSLAPSALPAQKRHAVPFTDIFLHGLFERLNGLLRSGGEAEAMTLRPAAPVGRIALQTHSYLSYPLRGIPRPVRPTADARAARSQYLDNSRRVCSCVR